MISLTTLGAARVHRGGVELHDLPAQRLRFALLVYLASEVDVAREDVVAMFWPDRDTARGRHALRQMLYELRHVLGEDWIELRRDRVVCAAAIDVREFERAAEEGRTADALALYEGAFLSGFAFDHAPFEGWAERRRAHLARLHRRLQREHIAMLVEAGRPEDALNAARRWVELDPLEDEAAHTLIERLFHSGQRTAALHYFETWQKQLAAELQVEPIEPTLELVARIRSGEEAPDATLPALRPARRADDVAPVAQATSAPPRPTRSPRVLRRPRVAAGALMVFLIASVATALMTRNRPAAPADLPRTLRVAVLAPEAPDSLVGMANELAEQLTAALGQSSMLEVVSTRSIDLRMDGGAAAVDSVGRLLSADYLVGGRLGRDGDAVRLSVELFDGRDGGILRTESMRRPRSESPTLVADAVDRLATIVREELGTQLEIQRYRVRTANPRAWQLVLDGKKAFANVKTLFDAGELDAARRELLRADGVFARAAQLDSRWATPLEQRARVRDMQAFIVAIRDTVGLRVLLREGLSFADRAIALDSALAGAHEVRGMILTKLFRKKLVVPDSIPLVRGAAEAALARAVHLEPNRQQAQSYLAEFHHADGEHGRAIIAAGAGYRSDPFSDLAASLLQVLFAASFEAGLDDQADSWCQTGRSRFADQPPFASCLFELHGWGSIDPEPDRLRIELERIPPSVANVQPYLVPMFEAYIAAAYARDGQADTARAILARLPPLPPGADEIVRATVHTQLGDFDTALSLLGRFIERSDQPEVLELRRFRKLRDHPDYARLLSGA